MMARWIVSPRGVRFLPSGRGQEQLQENNYLLRADRQYPSTIRRQRKHKPKPRFTDPYVQDAQPRTKNEKEETSPEKNSQAE